MSSTLVGYFRRCRLGPRQSRLGTRLLVRAEGAGAAHGLLDWLVTQGRVRGRSVEYSVGFAVNEPVRAAIATLPRARGRRRSTPPAESATAGTSPS